MLKVIANTNMILYLMIAVGILAILAKIVSQVTLKRLLKASGNMAKSTHKLIKLVRSKYEHTCMIYDTVENVDSFIEKYIYEYRVLGLRLHTWGQMEKQFIWLSGILGALGAFAQFSVYGFNEYVYQYGAGGIVEMVVLLVVYQLTDEEYKVEMVKMYMMDYLENVYVHRFARAKRYEKEKIDVINPDPAMAGEAKDTLAINIEGTPKKTVHENTREKETIQPALKEEAIRQILEEFLA